MAANSFVRYKFFAQKTKIERVGMLECVES